jgi:hypothetical protein
MIHSGAVRGVKIEAIGSSWVEKRGATGETYLLGEGGRIASARRSLERPAIRIRIGYRGIEHLDDGRFSIIEFDGVDWREVAVADTPGEAMRLRDDLRLQTR